MALRPGRLFGPMVWQFLVVVFGRHVALKLNVEVSGGVLRDAE